MNLRLIKKYFPIFIYLILVVYIFQFRYKLDKFGPYFTSDGAIKVYQTYQYRDNGLLSLECYYPGKFLDPKFEYYPISYPWAIFSSELGNEKCVLEYPPFFYWLGALLLKFIPLTLILYLPILFYCIAVFVFDSLLLKLGFVSLFRVFIVSLCFFSFPLLTSMDYTESPLFLSLYLIGFSRFVTILKNESPSKISFYFITGAILGFSFFLRLEIIFPFIFLLIVYLLVYKNLKKPFLIGLGFTTVVLFFFLYNFLVSGHILGFRYVSSIDLNENSAASFFKRLQLLKAYLLGDQIMVGLFQFNPLCYFIMLISAFYMLRGKLIKAGNLFLSAGLLSIISIPFYVTFYGGVGYFGLRYLEAPFFLTIIGFSYYAVGNDLFAKRSIRILLFIILSFIFYFNLVNTREGLKVLRSSSADLHSLHSEFNKSNKIVIHTSLYSSIWMGKSFLDKIHVLTTDTESFNNFLMKIDKNEVFLIIESPKEIYISSDIPKKLYKKYQTSVNLNSPAIQVIEEKNLFGVKLLVVKRI